MQTPWPERTIASLETSRYAKPVNVSKRVRFDIDRDVFRGRTFDFTTKFLPDSMSGVGTLLFLTPGERRYLSQIQGRTYANLFGLVERFIGAKMLDVSRDHWLGDQTALEALVRFTDEELKHQEMFRRLDLLAAEGMPDGYRFIPEANTVASLVLGKSSWAVLALMCHIEVFEKLSAAARDAAVDELIELVVAVDGIVRAQAEADAHWFVETCGRALTEREAHRIGRMLSNAYRWQYILSGVDEPRFANCLAAKTTQAQMQRIERALAPIAMAAKAS